MFIVILIVIKLIFIYLILTYIVIIVQKIWNKERLIVSSNRRRILKKKRKYHRVPIFQKFHASKRYYRSSYHDTFRPTTASGPLPSPARKLCARARACPTARNLHNVDHRSFHQLYHWPVYWINGDAVAGYRSGFSQIPLQLF